MVGKFQPVPQANPHAIQSTVKGLRITQAAKRPSNAEWLLVYRKTAAGAVLHPGRGLETRAKDRSRRIPLAHPAFDDAGEIVQFAAGDHDHVGSSQTVHRFAQAS